MWPDNIMRSKSSEVVPKGSNTKYSEVEKGFLKWQVTRGSYFLYWHSLNLPNSSLDSQF